MRFLVGVLPSMHHVNMQKSPKLTERFTEIHVVHCVSCNVNVCGFDTTVVSGRGSIDLECLETISVELDGKVDQDVGLWFCSCSRRELFVVDGTHIAPVARLWWVTLHRDFIKVAFALTTTQRHAEEQWRRWLKAKMPWLGFYNAVV